MISSLKLDFFIKILQKLALLITIVSASPQPFFKDTGIFP